MIQLLYYLCDIICVTQWYIFLNFNIISRDISKIMQNDWNASISDFNENVEKEGSCYFYSIIFFAKEYILDNWQIYYI